MALHDSTPAVFWRAFSARLDRWRQTSPLRSISLSRSPARALSDSSRARSQRGVPPLLLGVPSLPSLSGFFRLFFPIEKAITILRLPQLESGTRISHAYIIYMYKFYFVVTTSTFLEIMRSTCSVGRSVPHGQASEVLCALGTWPKQRRIKRACNWAGQRDFRASFGPLRTHTRLRTAKIPP